MIKTNMSLEERLWTMKGSDIVRYANENGVKVAQRNGSLKESKESAIRKIIDSMEEAEEVVEVEEVETSEETTEAVESEEAVEKPKARKRTTRKTFEELVAIVPAPADVKFVRMRNDSVAVKRGKKRLFRLDYVSGGYKLTADRKEMLENIPGVTIASVSFIKGLSEDAVVNAMRTVFQNQ